jgi:Icc-related predicted phosphoesterase
MNILAISDTESKALWDHYSSNKITNTDLILSCGDLNPQYLSFLVSCTNLPLLYVHGNHDDCYDQTPPEGCICIDDRIYVHEGIRILGLGGCHPYRDGNYMYTEQEMKRRILRVKYQILRHRGFDILLTHAPAFGLGDGDDFAHQGYKTFLSLLEKYAPKYMVHGHMHLQYDRSLQRTSQYKDTQIINAYEKHSWEY